jgi:hypothetical protein
VSNFLQIFRQSYEPAEFWQDGTVPLPMKQ